MFDLLSLASVWPNFTTKTDRGVVFFFNQSMLPSFTEFFLFHLGTEIEIRIFPSLRPVTHPGVWVCVTCTPTPFPCYRVFFLFFFCFFVFFLLNFFWGLSPDCGHAFSPVHDFHRLLSCFFFQIFFYSFRFSFRYRVTKSWVGSGVFF